ncbi:MAG: T9SS type A sorting domain-containing protein [Bacteroidota bacterium]
MKLATHRLGAGLLVALLCAAYCTPAQAQFTCENDVYISQSFDDGTTFQLSRLDQSVFPYALTSLGTTTTEYNALGFNYLDGNLYGIKPTTPNTVYVIDNTGTPTSIGTVSGLPTQSYFSGTIARDGTLYLINGGDPAVTPRNLYVISGLETGSPTLDATLPIGLIGGTAGARVSDIALANDDTFLYGFTRNTDQVVRIDPTDGSLVALPSTSSLGTIGGLWFNSYGELFGRRGTADGSYYQFDLTTGAATVISTGTVSRFNDAASCPYAVGFTKEANPTTVDPGDSFTYTFTLYNNGAELTGIDFSDVLPSPQLTFVDGTLTATLGGVVNSYGGTNTLTITDMTLPANTASVISVDVLIPAIAPATDFDNQATLSDLGVFLGETLDSDDPTTVIFGDPTTVSINIPVELTAFDVQLDGRAAQLAWATASETNNSGFEVQMRGPQDADFGTLSFVEGMGTTTEAQAYRFATGVLAPGTYTFRLKQVDFDGAFAFSAEVETTVELLDAFELAKAYPNPFGRQAATLSLVVRESQAVTVMLYDALGRVVATLHDGWVDAGTAFPMDIDASGMANGLYIVRATGADFATTQRVTVVK